MFGYVIPFRDELKVCELKEYQSYYCGLCRCLKDGYGITGQFALNYDMTFLGMLLTALYEPDESVRNIRCIAHPAHRHPAKQSVYLRYAADMDILLAYYKCMDDWNDEHKFVKAGYGKLLHHKGREIRQKYPDKAEDIRINLEKLVRAEKNGCDNIDYVAGCFGNICSAVFVCHNDGWADDLRQMGFFLGKFIYLADAYEDMEKDRENNCYNPFLLIEDGNNTKEKARKILLMMVSEAGKAFERLPVVQNVEILRNIIYSGVWSRFNQCTAGNKKHAHTEERCRI